MLFGRHRQMGNRQEPRNEGLQRNNQDVEKWPTAFRILRATTATDQRLIRMKIGSPAHVAERSPDREKPVWTADLPFRIGGRNAQ